MPAVARKGDGLATGHGCSGTTTIANPLTTSVYCNNILAAVKGAVSAVHAVPGGTSCVPHTSTVSGGSGTVFFENKPAARIGDAYEAGAVIGGSPNVFAG